MVKFIGDCVKDGKRECAPCDGPAPGFWFRGIRLVTSAATGLLEGAPEEQGEDRILGDVGGFADEMDDVIQGAVGNAGGKPAHDWPDNA